MIHFVRLPAKLIYRLLGYLSQRARSPRYHKHKPYLNQDLTNLNPKTKSKPRVSVCVPGWSPHQDTTPPTCIQFYTLFPPVSVSVFGKIIQKLLIRFPPHLVEGWSMGQRRTWSIHVPFILRAINGLNLAECHSSFYWVFVNCMTLCSSGMLY